MNKNDFSVLINFICNGTMIKMFHQEKNKTTKPTTNSLVLSMGSEMSVSSLYSLCRPRPFGFFSGTDSPESSRDLECSRDRELSRVFCCPLSSRSGDFTGDRVGDLLGLNVSAILSRILLPE